MIVDRNGTIPYFRQDKNYRHRPPASELLAVLDRLRDPEPSSPASN